MRSFPPVADAQPDGLLAVGGDLDPDTLLLAYKSGIFPWPYDQETLTWYAPPRRCILFLENLRVSRSLRKQLHQSNFSFAMNQQPRGVLRGCREAKRNNQDSTWITEDIVEAYLALHRLGVCQTFETYHGNLLVGGLYGLQLGKMFAGESMFYRQSGASKCAFLFLTTYLRRQGIPWIDCQVMTPLLESFGAEEIPREKFMELLAEALSQ